jgi:hypothetical protein
VTTTTVAVTQLITKTITATAQASVAPNGGSNGSPYQAKQPLNGSCSAPVTVTVTQKTTVTEVRRTHHKLSDHKLTGRFDRLGL